MDKAVDLEQDISKVKQEMEFRLLDSKEPEYIHRYKTTMIATTNRLRQSLGVSTTVPRIDLLERYTYYVYNRDLVSLSIEELQSVEFDTEILDALARIK